MNLPEFITSRLDQIVSEWECFARTLLPPDSTLDSLALRDHAKPILEAIAKDIVVSKSPEERSEKSTEEGSQRAETGTAAAIHGAQRQTEGFDLRQIFAEYRALRASVLRLWNEQSEDIHPNALYQMTRFNEAIDQALAESVGRYSEEISKSRDTFLAILGHDLRSPLQAIAVSAAAMSLPGINDDLRAKAVTRVRASAQAMSQMIADLLEFTRTRLGKRIPVEPKPFDVAEIVRASVAEVEAGNPQRSFRIETGDDLIAFVDPPRMQQVVTNLLANAVRHGYPGTAVHLIARKHDEAVVLEVKNKGLKIPADSLQVIFDPLVQLDESAQKQGARRSTNLGLGLFIAREIVSGHRGSMQAASSDEETVFTVEIPRTLKERRTGPRTSAADRRPVAQK